MAKKTERELIDETVHRLVGKFSQLPTGLIAAVVEDAYKHFEQSVIRDYVPLLVQRRADNELVLFAADPDLAPGLDLFAADSDLTPELAPTS